jgi:hypothetical protein
MTDLVLSKQKPVRLQHLLEHPAKRGGKEREGLGSCKRSRERVRARSTERARVAAG